MNYSQKTKEKNLKGARKMTNEKRNLIEEGKELGYKVEIETLECGCKYGHTTDKNGEYYPAGNILCISHKAEQNERINSQFDASQQVLMAR